MKKVFKGFTLAEVLITLGIIGVVAAVTLPSLQVNVNKQALSTQISKTYSQLQEGLRLYMMDQHLDSLNENNFGLTTFAKNYLQVQYVCNGSTDTNCFADAYTSISNGGSSKKRASIMGYTGTQSYILRDGTTIALVPATEIREYALMYEPDIMETTFSTFNPVDTPMSAVEPFAGAYLMAASTDAMATKTAFGDLSNAAEAQEFQMLAFAPVNMAIVDVNGKKGPNKIGYDLFSFNLNADGTAGPTQAAAFEDIDKKDATIATGLSNCKSGKDFGGGCFIHLLRNNFKFDY